MMGPGRRMSESEGGGPLTRACAAVIIAVLLLAWLIDIPW